MKYVKYSPMYRKMANGSLTAGIMLAHILFWASKKEEFYKTDKEFSVETGLTIAEIKNAKKILKELGFIEISKKGIPVKTFYKINTKKFKEAFKDTTENLEADNRQTCSSKSAQLSGRNPTKGMGENNQTNTYKTHKNNIEEKNTKKDKFEQLLSEIKKKAPNLTEAQIELIKDFYEYRKQIKKPIHTIKPIISYLKNLKIIQDEGYDIKEAIELMKENEWQTIKPKYVEGTLEKEVKYVW